MLSNNHVNSIIVHKFDFSDEEVMAYYISFLKTLSLKLNAHTVHFFYNEVRGQQFFTLSSNLTCVGCIRTCCKGCSESNFMTYCVLF